MVPQQFFFHSFHLRPLLLIFYFKVDMARQAVGRIAGRSRQKIEQGKLSLGQMNHGYNYVLDLLIFTLGLELEFFWSHGDYMAFYFFPVAGVGKHQIGIAILLSPKVFNAGDIHHQFYFLFYYFGDLRSWRFEFLQLLAGLDKVGGYEKEGDFILGIQVPDCICEVPEFLLFQIKLEQSKCGAVSQQILNSPVFQFFRSGAGVGTARCGVKWLLMGKREIANLLN